MSQPPDIDKMVSGFLSELDTLSESLGLTNKGESGGEPRPEAARPYRNIDVLLMSDSRTSADRRRKTEPVSLSGAGRRRLIGDNSSQSSSWAHPVKKFRELLQMSKGKN